MIRTNGTYKGYPTDFGQQDRIARSTSGKVVAAHAGSIVRVTASALKILITNHRLDRLFPGSPGLVAINTLTVTRPGDVFFRANYYAPHGHGCGNIRAELTAGGRLKVLSRSASGLVCG